MLQSLELIIKNFCDILCISLDLITKVCSQLSNHKNFSVKFSANIEIEKNSGK